MRTQRYASVLLIFGFGSFMQAQIASQMHLTEPDSLVTNQPLNLNKQDFSISDLNDFEDRFEAFEFLQQKPNGFKPLMPILKPDDSFEYKMRYLDRNDPYQYSMPILEPVMIKRYYQS